ncbi:MAG: hypothetical protein GOU98_01190 [Candidatus Altiarchaeota archaeon]|nr:hypothetical protein [Candidatus Altiarchaeota archaeon]
MKFKLKFKLNLKKRWLVLKELLDESYLHFNAVKKPKLLDLYKSNRDGLKFFVKKNKFNLVKVGLLVIFFLFFTSKYAPIVEKVNGTFSGIINANMNWSGTIYISGDLVVPPSFTIFISPGTKILFLNQDSEFHDNGRTSLFNVSDPTNSKEYEVTHASLSAKIIGDGVIFTSAKEPKEYADWSDLTLFAGSILNNSIVEYSRGGIITNELVYLENITSRYNLWNCFDVGGGIITKSRANNCWNHCYLIKSNSTITDSGANECNIGFGIYSNVTLKNIFVLNFCNNFTGDFSQYKNYKAASLISGTNASSEGIYGGRIIYRCS